jgi:drug/metabolite transporter (DMT)-like permease
VVRSVTALGSALRSRLSVGARYRDAVLFVLLAALFGISFVAIKTGLRELPPVFFAGLRFDVAAVVLLAYLAATRPRSAWLPQSRRDLAGIAVAGAFLIALNNGLLFVGQGPTTPAAASVMYGLNPILAPVFAWALLGQRLSTVGALGIGVALAGVVIIVQPSPEAFAGGDEVVGQLLVLGAAAAVALGSVSLRRVEPSLKSLPVTAWAMAVGAVVLHGASAAMGEVTGPLLAVDTLTVLSILSIALPSTALAYPIYFGLIRRVGPVRANLVAYAMPIFAALTGFLVLQSPIDATTVVGFFVVVAGFALVERRVIREELKRVLETESGPVSTLADGRADDSSDAPCDD